MDTIQVPNKKPCLQINKNKMQGYNCVLWHHYITKSASSIQMKITCNALPDPTGSSIGLFGRKKEKKIILCTIIITLQ